MKTKLFIILMLSMLVFNSGCKTMCDNFGIFCPKSLITKPEFNTQEDINEAQKTIKESSDTIKEATNNISKEATNINQEANRAQDKVPIAIKPQIAPHIASIKQSSNNIMKDTNKINKANAELSGAKSLLDDIEKKVITTEKALDILAKERDDAVISRNKAEADRDSALHKSIRWLILGSIVGAGALGIFGLMYGNKLSLTLSATCIVIMSIAIFVETYFLYLAIGGGVILLGLVGVLIYNIIIQKRAFSEVVNTVEIAKDNLSEENRNKLFGGKNETGIMDSIQRKSTMEEVKKEKNKISILWKYAKNKGKDENI